MFPVFPLLFPVCSQFTVAWFHRVPRVPYFRRSRHEDDLLYPFLARREHWVQW